MRQIKRSDLVAVRFPPISEIFVAKIFLCVAICLTIGAVRAEVVAGRGGPAQGYAQNTGGYGALPARQRPQPATQPPASVYLLRGFMNIFSLGMDDLTEKIQVRGIAATVANHADADSLVGGIAARYASGDHGPIILVGHSLGADVVIAMAEALGRNAIPIALVFLFDGTAPHTVPGNVASAINFTLQYDLTPGAGFRGTISNIDLRNDRNMDHLYIDKSPSLQAQALDYILRAAAASAKPNPSARRH